MDSAQLPPPALPSAAPRSSVPSQAAPQPRAAASGALRNAQPVSGRGCIVCSRLPAIAVPVRREVGLIFVRQTTLSNSVLCRDHGTQRAQLFLARTLIQGWWSVISFFVNFGAIWTDLGALSQYKRLAPPQGDVTVNPAAFARRAPFGGKKQLLTLCWIVLGIVVAGVLVGFIGAALR